MERLQRWIIMGSMFVSGTACAALIAQGEHLWRHYARLDPPASMLPLGIGCAVAATESGWIAVGAGADRDTGFDSGSLAIFRHDGDGVPLQQVVAHPRASRDAGFGEAVSFGAQGTLLCAGSPRETGARGWPDDFQIGCVHLYRSHPRGPIGTTHHAKCEWLLEESIQSQEPRPTAQFGASLAASGEFMIVGSPAHDGRVAAGGRVEAFVHTPAGWKFDGELVPPVCAVGMRFGTSVALSVRGEVILALVGSPHFTGVGAGSGCADLFRREITGWRHQARLTSPNPQASGWFGMSVAIRGHDCAIGAPQETPPESDASPQRAGVVHLFTRSNRDPSSSWIASGSLLSPMPWCGQSPSRPEAFGMSLAILNNLLVVGASEACAYASGGGEGADDGVGTAYLFKCERGGEWIQASQLVAPTARAEVHDGYRIALGAMRGEPFVVVGRLGNPDESPGPSEANVYALTPAQGSVVDSADR